MPSHRYFPATVGLVTILVSACTTGLSTRPSSTAPSATLQHGTPSPPSLTTSTPPRPLQSATPGAIRPTIVFNAEAFPASPGYYVAYSRPSSNPPDEALYWHDIILVGANGDPLGTVATMPGNDWAFSPDAHTLAYSSWQRIDLLDLHSGTSVTLPGFHWGIGSWSPDGLYLLTSEDAELRIILVPSGERILLTRCRQWAPTIEADCFDPTWSPDGAFISFSVDFPRSGPRDPLEGVYLLDAACVFEVETCWPKLEGPLPFAAGYDWAPTGQIIAFPSNVWAPGQGIGLFSIDQRRTTAYIPDEWANGETTLGSVAWSPDGSRIATSWGRIIDVASRSDVGTFAGDVANRIQWITIPPTPSPTPGA